MNTCEVSQYVLVDTVVTRVESLPCAGEIPLSSFDVFYILSIKFCKSPPCILQAFQSGVCSGFTCINTCESM